MAGPSRRRCIDWASLIAAKDKEINRLEGVYHKLLRDSGVKLIEGRGRLIDPHTVEIDGKRHTAANILVATGAHPVLPAIPGIEHAITSNEALDLPALPRHIIIVGGSYIAVEFAGIFHGLGAEVTLVCRSDRSAQWLRRRCAGSAGAGAAHARHRDPCAHQYHPHRQARPWL